MNHGNVARGNALAHRGLGFDDASIEKAAMAIAWGELGLGVKVRSFWKYFHADRDRFQREARQFLTMVEGATMAVAAVPALHGMALAITQGVQREADER
jgi:hypothetical protein